MDKRTIIAFVLIGIITLIMTSDFYQKRFFPKRPVQAERSFTKTDTLVNPKSIEKRQIEKKEEKNKAIQEQTKTQQSPKIYSSDILNQDDEKKEITIETPLYRAKLSNFGGGLVSWQLLKYMDSDSQYVEIVPEVMSGQPALGFLMEKDTVVYENLIYQQETENLLSSKTVFLNEKGKKFSIKYSLLFQDGKKISKEFTFYADHYDFDLNVSVTGFSNLVIDKNYQIYWKASFLPIEKPIRNDLGQYKLYAFLGEDLQDFNVSEKETKWKIETVSGSSVNWTALRTKYFVSAIVPMDNKGRNIFYKAKGIPYSGNQRFKYYEYAINMPLNEGQTQFNQFKFYLGPLEYNGLKKLGLKLDKLIMSSGGYERLFRPFSIIILVSFKFIHQFISNYGIVIIIFSILIKLILYPLTHKSYVSMKKMQLVQPMMTELREKYKSDPAQLNKKMMELYKTYGVNPMGGCLPMLLQMPLLIGLFIVFRSTIELRGADFFWWINDLSRPDSIFTLPFVLPLYGNQVGVLPIVMGLTMFFQQKSTMQDPRQKMMAYFMPIFFVLLFNSFPSGLNLYYTLFNVWTIIQQKFVKTEDIQLKPVEKKPARRGRGKK